MAGGLLRLLQTVPNDPDSLDVILDANRENKADDQALLAQNTRYLGLNDEDLVPLGMTRQALTDKNNELNARILAYGWERHDVTLNVVKGGWETPTLVNSFCGESGANVVGNSIDGLTSTHWRHAVDERHSAIYQLRTYPLRAEIVSFYHSATEPVNEQLTNIDIRMSKELANIDDAGNLLVSGANPTWVGAGGTHVEIPLAPNEKASAVWIKIEFSNSNSVANTSQIRWLRVFCTPRKP